MRVAAIVPAAGKGRRFGPRPKLFVNVDGKPLLYYTLKNLAASYPFTQILIAADRSFFKKIQSIMDSLKLRSACIVQGGHTRAASVNNALRKVSGAQWALVHDAARPLVTPRIVCETLRAAQRSGGAIAAIPAVATVKRVNAQGVIIRTEDRQSLYLAQTPQVFRVQDLLRRYRTLGSEADHLTDEASFFDGTGIRVALTLGSPVNLKITTREDLELMRFYLNKRQRGRA